MRRIAVIKAAQRLGIPLAEIGAALATLPTDRTVTADDWTTYLHIIDEKLAATVDRLNDALGEGLLTP